MSQEYLTEHEFLIELQAIINRVGDEEKFCMEYKVDGNYLEIVLNGAVIPSKGLLQKIGYTRQLMYVKMENK